MRDKVNVHSGFHNDLFHVDQTDECSFKVWGGYRVSIYDEGSVVRVVLNEGEGNFESVNERLDLPDARQKGVSEVERKISQSGLEISVRFTPHKNRDGRIQNKDAVYAAVKKEAIKPLLAAVYSSENYST